VNVAPVTVGAVTVGPVTVGPVKVAFGEAKLIKFAPDSFVVAVLLKLGS